MAKINKEDFITSLKEMTMLEILELVDAMKEEFGIDPTAVAVAGPAAGGAEEEAEKNVNVVITSPGASKIAVIKLVRELTGLGLKEAKALVDGGGAVKEDLPVEEANEIKAKLEEAGATIELQ